MSKALHADLLEFFPASEQPAAAAACGGGDPVDPFDGISYITGARGGANHFCLVIPPNST